MTALAESLRGLSDAEARVLLLALPAERLGPIARELDDEALYVLVHGPAEDGDEAGPEAPERLTAAQLNQRILAALADGPISAADLRTRVGVRGLPVSDRLQALRREGRVARSGPRTGGVWSLPEQAVPARTGRRGGPRAGASRKGRVEDLLAYIEQHPGSPTTQIARDLGYSCPTSAAVTLRRLVAEGQLRREARREGRTTLAYWYPAGRAKSAAPRKAAPAAEEEE